MKSTTVGINFGRAYNAFYYSESPLLSETERKHSAFERATADFLRSSGIALLKAAPNPAATNLEFKKIGAEKTITPEGTTTYTKSDCP